MPLPFGLRLKEEEVENGMLRYQWVGATWRLAVPGSCDSTSQAGLS